MYIASPYYGSRRYHIVEQWYGSGIVIEQLNTDEKWSKRVEFADDELPALIKTLLIWHLEKQRQAAENVDYITDEQPF